MTKSDYQMMKRMLFAAKDYTDRIDGAEVNGMIQDACGDALTELEDDERTHVLDAAETVKANCNRLGDKGALELLAALGDYLNHNGNGGKG